MGYTVLDLRRAATSGHIIECLERNARPSSPKALPAAFPRSSVKYKLPPAGKSIVIIFDSSSASWRRIEMMSSSARSENTSVEFVLSRNCTNIYSVPAALSGVGEYWQTSGVGSPVERRKASVATSLATAK